MDQDSTDGIGEAASGRSGPDPVDPEYWVDPPVGIGNVAIVEVRNNSAPLDVALAVGGYMANGVIQGILGSASYDWLKAIVLARKGVHPTVGSGLTESGRREIAHLAVCARRAELGTAVPKGYPASYLDGSNDGQSAFIYFLEYDDFRARVVLPKEEIKRGLIHVTIYESRREESESN